MAAYNICGLTATERRYNLPNDLIFTYFIVELYPQNNNWYAFIMQ